jgi:hypothetical protein
MVRLVPKLRTPKHAVRLTEDLLAEAGQWLIIQDDETIDVMSDAEVNALFQVVSDRSQERSRKERRTPRSDQGIRILTALAKTRSGLRVKTRDLYKIVPAADRHQISSRLFLHMQHGLLTRDAVLGEKGYYWSITDKGRQFVADHRNNSSGT